MHSRHIPQLDGLRGSAILLVLVGHVMQKSPPLLSWPLYQLASLGVLLFFVLSGYLITTLISEEKESTGNIGLREFYLRRIFRLLPALLVFLVAIGILSSSGRIPHVKLYEFLACIFYLRNIIGRNDAVAHLWSLSLEEQFYLLWPPIIKLVKSKKLIIISALVVVAMCLWRAIAMHIHLFDYNLGIYYTRPWFRMDSILIGCCLGLFLRKDRRLPKFVSATPVAVIWISLIAWTLIAPSLAPELYLTGQMLGCLWILYRAVQATGSPILSSQPLRFVGRISYSLYLWQQIFLEVHTPSWGILHLFPLNLVASVGLALGSYYLIERPFLRLKERFTIREPLASVELLAT